jgi:16S rRNA (uracil1498-N3)-methyltransferase
MARFFVEEVGPGEILLGQEAARHLRALREKPGALVELCDGRGTEYVCRLLRLGKDGAALGLESSRPACAEPALRVFLYQGLPKQDKLELVIQKCVELGVHAIIPMETQRSVPRATQNKQPRWQKISEAAAAQSGRGYVPAVGATLAFQEAVGQAAQTCGRVFIPYEKFPAGNLAQAFAGPPDEAVALFIGPEGGFAPGEIMYAVERGAQPVSLGKRVLRTETAGMAAVLLLLMARGEF